MTRLKKKVLLFIEDGSFTFDNRVLRETKALREAGWSVTVISPKFKGDPLYRRIDEDLRAYAYPKPDAETLMGHFKEVFVTLTLGSLLTFWVYLRHGFSVFHACNPMDILWLIAWPYKLIGKKFIFDQHDLVPELILSRSNVDPQGWFIKIFLWFEKRSYRLADVVIATNESYKEKAVVRGKKRTEDVFVVRNGPDLRKFRPVPPNKGIKSEHEILVGYLGNMNPQDGADYLLRAARVIVRERRLSHIKFVFIGGGSSQPRLHQESRSWGLDDSVTFTGRIPDAEMLAALSACDICVQPDPMNPLNDLSTMNKVMEYMAMEKPVIAFDLKETRVSGGDAALYVKPNDVGALVDQIIFLADRPDLRRQMGRAGRRRIEGMLAWKFSVEGLLNAYKAAGRSKHRKTD